MIFSVVRMWYSAQSAFVLNFLYFKNPVDYKVVSFNFLFVNDKMKMFRVGFRIKPKVSIHDRHKVVFFKEQGNSQREIAVKVVFENCRSKNIAQICKHKISRTSKRC